jgi:hypothetical protein
MNQGISPLETTNYRAMLDASQEKAHQRNIATKIDRDMQELRSQVETSPTARRRWVWELIQNAKDAHQNGKVRIQIEFDTKNRKVVFRHSGHPFTTDNIRFLIEQISNKERIKDDTGTRTPTGKFGTGFLATHLLSEKVYVEGVAKEPALEYKQFEFELDRSGYDLDMIAASVEEAKQAVSNLDELPSDSRYDPKKLNTAFHYPLADSISLIVAKAGIHDLFNCLPYVLGFVPEIERVDIPFEDLGYSKKKDHSWTGATLPNDVSLFLTDIEMSKLSNPHQESPVVHVVTISRGLTSLSIPIERRGKTIVVLPINESTPRLFCDFPLVGTECFPFPAVINNPHFDPTDPRDGIFLTGRDRINPRVENNRRILSEAVRLFLQLVDIAVAGRWDGLHNFATIHPLKTELKWVEKSWYSDNLLKPIREKIVSVPIVETAIQGTLASMRSEDQSAGVWFPSAANKGLRERLWQLANSWFPNALPKQDHVEMWHNLIWDECGKLSPKQLASFVENCGSLADLSTAMPSVDCLAWLRSFYAMLESDKDNYDSIINSKAIFPNQNGNLCRIACLLKDAGDTEDSLKDILKLLGRDIRTELILENFDVPILGEREFSQKYVVDQISLIATERASNREQAKGCRDAFQALLGWFRANSVLAQRLFPSLYGCKHLLYDDDTIMENMDKADQLDQLLCDSGVSSIDELKQLISTKKVNGNEVDLLPITQEILASLGITSVDDWRKAMEDRAFAAMFSHESVPTTEMFVYAQTLIEVAKRKIITYLTTLPNYDVSNAEEIAPTVFGGIAKDGREIQIVARPATSGKVIIYYSAEQDTLDFADSELWVDTGLLQKVVTLGHVLKMTGIKKFPI